MKQSVLRHYRSDRSAPSRPSTALWTTPSRTSAQCRKAKPPTTPPPTLSGSAAPGDVVSILDNRKVIGTVKADSSGKWSFTPDTARWMDGQHTPSPSRRLTAGNARTSGTFPIVIDTAAPSPAENIVINDNVGDKQGQ
ncbi:hypothetical protein KIF59_23055 [Enterobacter cloacae subsp. cloacae]|nr:hypothetical protein [Enterobacter cloacae subsp. cloacae]